MSTNYKLQFLWSTGKWWRGGGCTTKRSGIRCTMCFFLHIRGFRPQVGRYAPPPGALNTPRGGVCVCVMR